MEITTWDIKEPLEEGKEYLVPCHLVVEEGYLDEIKEVMVGSKVFIYPLLPIHTHKNNLRHYHIDNRFVDVNKEHSKYRFMFDGRIPTANLNLQYLRLRCKRDFIVCADSTIQEEVGDMSIDNKCPHLGYDLSQIKPINGVITCPMHNTKICALTKKTLK